MQVIEQEQGGANSAIVERAGRREDRSHRRDRHGGSFPGREQRRRAVAEPARRSWTPCRRSRSRSGRAEVGVHPSFLDRPDLVPLPATSRRRRALRRAVLRLHAPRRRRSSIRSSGSSSSAPGRPSRTPATTPSASTGSIGVAAGVSMSSYLMNYVQWDRELDATMGTSEDRPRQHERRPRDTRGLQAQPAGRRLRRAVLLLDLARRRAPGLPEPAQPRERHGAGGRRRRSRSRRTPATSTRRGESSPRTATRGPSTPRAGAWSSATASAASC